jgi:alpha-1,2-mannosyltransferase
MHSASVALLQRRLSALFSAWPRSRGHARAQAILAAAVLWAALSVTFLAQSGNRSIAGPIKGADFLQFYTSGYLVRTHQAAKLYDIGAFHDTQVSLVPESAPELYPPVYPPQMGILFSWLTYVPYRVALLLWNTLTVCLFGAIVWTSWRPVRDWIPEFRFVAAAAAAFAPFWSLVLYGQVTILILLIFWAAWIALDRTRPFLAGCVFGALAVKPQFAIPLVAVAILCREWRMVSGAILSIALQVVVVVRVLGTSVLTAYAGFMALAAPHADLLEPKPYQSHSLRAVTRLLPSALGLPAWALTSLLAVTMCVLTWRRCQSLRVRMSVLILTSVLVNPHLIIYDATVLALPILWLGAQAVQQSEISDARLYWRLVYWLFVTLLAPTAAMIGIQVSVLLMGAILCVAVRTALRGGTLDLGWSAAPGRDLARPSHV